MSETLTLEQQEALQRLDDLPVEALPAALAALVSPRRRPAPAMPVACKPWCEYRDNHGREIFREDQRCYTVERRIDMTLQPQVEESIYDAERGWIDGPDFLTVYGEQQADAAAPAIKLQHDVTGAPLLEVALRPDEARALAAALLAVLEEVGA